MDFATILLPMDPQMIIEHLAGRCGRRSRGETSGILETLQQLDVMAHHELKALANFLPVPVTLDVRTGNWAIKHRLGGVRFDSRRTRTAVTVF
jgi:hypothetical protein